MRSSVATATAGGIEELRAALQRELGRAFARPVEVARLERRPSEYASTHPIEELHVELNDGTDLRLILKELSPRALLHVARGARPRFLTDPRREIEVYRRILAAPIPAPSCWGAVEESDVGRYWLFLENVTGVELPQIGEPATWLDAAAELARMHSHLARRAAISSRSTRLLRYSGRFYRGWLRRAQANLTRRTPPAAESQRFERLAAGYPRVIEALRALPSTLIHGDLYPSNVLVVNEPTGPGVRFVDWELAAIAPGIVDLASLTSGEWTDEERLAMASAYRRALDGRLRLSPDRFANGLDLCRLHLAVQWLGWSPGWSPPPAHEHDWLREALLLAERIGL